MVVGPVIALIMADRTDHRIIVQAGGQLDHVLRISNARNRRFNRRKLAAELHRSIRLWIERFEVSRSAIHPDQDTAFRLAGGNRSAMLALRTSLQAFHESRAQEAAEAQLQRITPREAVTSFSVANDSPLETINPT